MACLIVPDFQKRSAVSADTNVQRHMHRRLERGDELALHGYHHCDDGPKSGNPHEYFMRRICTRACTPWTCATNFSRTDWLNILQRLIEQDRATVTQIAWLCAQASGVRSAA